MHQNGPKWSPYHDLGMTTHKCFKFVLSDYYNPILIQMNTLGGKELESVMIGSRGVVGSPMGNTKMEQNGYSSITDQRRIQFVLVGSYNPILIKVDTWKEI